MKHLKINKLTILIIDDDPFCKEVLELKLQESDCTILTGSCEEDFKNLTDNIRFDIIFMDYLLPCKNGTNLMEEYRKKYPSINTTFVCTTAGIYTLKDVCLFMKMGYDDVLPKPYNETYLKNILARLSE